MVGAASCTSRTVISASRSIGRIDQHGNTNSLGHQITQEPQPLCHHLRVEKIDAGRVATWPGETGDKTKLDRVFADTENDRDRRRRSFGRQRGRVAGRGDHGHLSANQIGHQRRQAIVLALQPVVLDRHVLAFDVAGFVEAFAENAGQNAHRGIGPTRLGQTRLPASLAAARAPRTATPPPRRKGA